MTERELREALVELAEGAGLRVRGLRAAAGGEGEPVPASAVCRVRGELWVVLSGAETAEEHCAVLAAALREHASAWLEERWLPPAIRERLG